MSLGPNGEDTRPRGITPSGKDNMLPAFLTKWMLAVTDFSGIVIYNTFIIQMWLMRMCRTRARSLIIKLLPLWWFKMLAHNLNTEETKAPLTILMTTNGTTPCTMSFCIQVVGGPCPRNLFLFLPYPYWLFSTESTAPSYGAAHPHRCPRAARYPVTPILLSLLNKVSALDSEHSNVIVLIMFVCTGLACAPHLEGWAHNY